MFKRTLTALLLIPPVVYLIGWSPEWLFVLAVATAVVLALREYFALCRAMGFRVLSWAGYGVSIALCCAQASPWRGRFWILFMIVVPLLIVPTLALRRSTDLKEYLSAISVTIFGILYIGLTLSFLISIRFFPEYVTTGSLTQTGEVKLDVGPICLLLLFLVIWAGDICAYLVGRSLGRTPFFARISPRKTWEGALAGLAGSLLAAWAFVHFWAHVDLKSVLLIAGWIALAGQVGDLVESAIKRGANQKDSGTLLPGHGGFLDRIDSLLFGAPALWLAMFVMGSLS